MKSYFFGLLFILIVCGHVAFGQDAKEMHETAKTFMKQGDYTNAVVVLNRALELEPTNPALTKDLALSYYFNSDYTRALNSILPLLERNNADDQSYQVAGNIYKSLNKPEEAEKLYKKGLKKFPESGPLYNELGEIMCFSVA